MENKSANLIASFFLTFILAVNLFGQEHGKIFSANEANSLFGEVLESEEITVETLNQLLQNTNSVIMFRLSNNQLTILGDNRSLLFSTASYSESNEVFNLFSKEKVSEFLQRSNGMSVFVEKRKKVLTLTSGVVTLELAVGCPPLCG
jgi:hypothetical protein